VAQQTSPELEKAAEKKKGQAVNAAVKNTKVDLSGFVESLRAIDTLGTLQST